MGKFSIQPAPPYELHYSQETWYIIGPGHSAFSYYGAKDAPLFRFSSKEQAEVILSMINQAYAAGQRNAQKTMQNALGIKRE